MNRRLLRAPHTVAPARRRPVAAALGVVAALTLSGCQYTSVIQTERPYEPADGVSTQVGDLQLRNLLIVAGEKGGTGNLVGRTSNPTDRSGQISFTVQGGRAIQMDVPARQSVQLSTPDQLIPAGPINVMPGALVPVQVSSPTGGTTTLQVPVKYPQGPYADLAPKGWTPSPEPSNTTAAGSAEH